MQEAAKIYSELWNGRYKTSAFEPTFFTIYQKTRDSRVLTGDLERFDSFADSDDEEKDEDDDGFTLRVYEHSENNSRLIQEEVFRPDP